MTRRAQYLMRRRKYTAKMQRWMKRIGSTWKDHVQGTPVVKHTKVPWPMPVGGKQLAPRVSRRQQSIEGPPMLHAPPLIVVSGGGYGNPPHQRVDPSINEPGVPPYALAKSVGWWDGPKRRRKYMGKKPGRLNGAQRRARLNRIHHYLQTGVWLPYTPDA